MRYLVAAVALLGLVGCEKTGEPAKNANPPVATEVEEHEHVHGPHGGHPFAVEGVDGKVEAIVNKTNNLFQVFFLDAAGKAVKSVKVEKVVVKTDKLGGKSFELKAVNADANGLASEYSLEDKELVNIAGLEPVLEVTIDGKTTSGKMDFH